MKKILPLLFLVMLVVALAVPALASTTYTYVFDDYEAIRSLDSVSVDVPFIANGENFVGFRIFRSELVTGLFFIPVDGPEIWVASINDYSVDMGWRKPEYRVMTFTDLTDEQYYGFSALGTFSPFCDGFTCPATDLNQDNICDDCGLTLAYSLRNDTYGYNGVYLPAVPDVFNGRDTYYTLYDGGTGSYTLVASTVPFQQYGEDVVLNGQAEVVFLAAQTGQTEWSQFSSQDATWTNYSIREFTTLVWSSHHVTSVDSGEKVFDGDANFLPPLWEMMDKVTQGEMTGLTAKVVGAMKILALCGVGCLALLVVLKLFGKRSLIYRN